MWEDATNWVVFGWGWVVNQGRVGFGDNCPPAATRPRDLQGHRHSARPCPRVERRLGWGVCAVGHRPPALLSMGSAFWAAVLLAELGILCSGGRGLAVPALLGSLGELRALRQQERPANETNEQGQHPRARSLRHLTEARHAPGPGQPQSCRLSGSTGTGFAQTWRPGVGKGRSLWEMTELLPQFRVGSGLGAAGALWVQESAGHRQGPGSVTKGSASAATKSCV